jgi:hypothetical protein
MRLVFSNQGDADLIVGIEPTGAFRVLVPGAAATVLSDTDGTFDVTVGSGEVKVWDRAELTLEFGDAA